MVHFDLAGTADFARLRLEPAIPLVSTSIGSRISLKLLFGAEWMRLPPLAHVSGVAVAAISLARIAVSFAAD